MMHKINFNEKIDIVELNIIRSTFAYKIQFSSVMF